MRLIDANELKEKLLKERDAIPLTCTERYGFGVEFPNHHGQSMRGGIKKALRCMEQTPTVDAVPVVRCKDCKYWHESTGFCSKNSYFIDSNEISCSPLESPTWTMWGENDFCSNGEMKDK